MASKFQPNRALRGGAQQEHARDRRARGERHRRNRPASPLSWLATHQRRRAEVKKALRKTLFKYKLHAEEELFEKAYGHIKQYY
jgi:hypothetical protein